MVRFRLHVCLYQTVITAQGMVMVQVIILLYSIVCFLCVTD